MVESAPTDRWRLEPKAANASVPAMKAKKPICGAKPPSRAVAICSGIAMAASVSPAAKSRLRSAAERPRSVRNSGHGAGASGRSVGPADCMFQPFGLPNRARAISVDPGARQFDDRGPFRQLAFEELREFLRRAGLRDGVEARQAGFRLRRA